MAARSTFNLATGNAINETWTDGVMNAIVTSTTSVDTTAEGQLSAHTSQDRFWSHTGSAQQRLALHYSSSGRTWCEASASGVGFASATLGQYGWTAGTDGDAMYTGWDGTHYNFAAPFGGLYLVSFALAATASGSGSNWYAKWTADSYGYTFPGISGTGAMGAGSFCVALTTGQGFYLEVYQDSGSSKTINGVCTVVWLGP